MSDESAQPVASGEVDQLDHELPAQSDVSGDATPEVTDAAVTTQETVDGAGSEAVEEADTVQDTDGVVKTDAAEETGTAGTDAAEADAAEADAADVDAADVDAADVDGAEAGATVESEDSSDEDSESSAETAEDADEVDPLDEEGDIAADYLEELLDIADLDGDIDTYVEAGRAHVSIVTDSQVLVGKNGKVLEALQELARLAVMTETGHRSRLMLDVAGFREVRRKELLVLAAEAIASVKSTGEPEHLPPMNPFERKIIHDAVAAAGLTSESEGVEPKRHVVISA